MLTEKDLQPGNKLTTAEGIVIEITDRSVLGSGDIIDYSIKRQTQLQYMQICDSGGLVYERLPYSSIFGLYSPIEIKAGKCDSFVISFLKWSNANYDWEEIE